MTVMRSPGVRPTGRGGIVTVRSPGRLRGQRLMVRPAAAASRLSTASRIESWASR